MSVRTALRIAASLALPSVIACTFGLQPAAAATPKIVCGATLTSNSSLTSDLKCAGKGLTLGAGVRLDLNGHTLTGNGTGTAVRFSPRGGGVVSNGRISNWEIGLDVDSMGNDGTGAAATTRVSGVTVDKAPSYAFNGATLAITKSSLIDSEIRGMYSDINADNSTFTRSSINTSQTAVVVTRSTIVGGAVTGADGLGVSISNSTMDGTGSGGAPAGCFESDISITNSTVKNYTVGIGGATCSVSLDRSHFANNPGGVVSTYFWQGTGGSASVTNSTITTSGIAVQGGSTLTVTGTKFTNNVTGILVNNYNDGDDGAGTEAVISGNIFLANSSSGIRSTSTDIAIRKNKSANNGRYGIYAPGATDKGGNIAYGNTLANCVGITCTGR